MAIIERKKRILLNEPHIVTASGGVANFSTDLVAPLKSCKVEFLPVQSGSGDPSPSNVRPITGWNAVNCKHFGQNSLNINRGTVTTKGVKFTLLNDGDNNPYGFNVNGTPTDTNVFVNMDLVNAITFSIPPGNYIVRGYSQNVAIQVRGINTSGTDVPIYRSNLNGDNSFIIPANYKASWSRLQVISTGYVDEDIKPIIIPANAPLNDYNVTFPETVYGGYVDLVTGELVATHSGFTIDQNTTIDGNASGNTLYFSTPLAMYRKMNMVASDGFYCDSFATVTGSNQGLGARCGFISGSTFYSIIYIYNLASNVSEVTDKATGIAYLKNLAPSFTYKLDTPKTYQLTPQQIKTLIGQNNIWSNANGNATVKYWKH